MKKVYKIVINDSASNISLSRDTIDIERLLNDLDSYIKYCDYIDIKLKIISDRIKIVTSRLETMEKNCTSSYNTDTEKEDD